MMSMGGAIQGDTKKERIIPIRILKSPHVIEEEDEDEENVARQEEQASKRHSLSVELDDGTITETLGTSFPLSSSKMDEEFQQTTSSSSSRVERIRIEEIGMDTLKREMKGSAPEEKQEKSTNTVRLVPISLPDGKIIQADSEETLTTFSEFTTTTHEEFPTAPKASNAESQTKESISVPINVTHSSSSKTEKTEASSFPTFDDIEGPSNWASFPSAKDALPGNGEEKVIPIVLEQQKSSSERSRQELSSSTKRRSQEILVTEETLAKNGYKPDKKPEAGRPTVRFNVDTDDSEKRKKEETENEIHKIDQDISKIWNELKELDSEPRPGSSVSSWPRTTNPPPRYPKQSPGTTHKVSVLESPKYTPIRDSSLTRPGAIKSSPGSTIKLVKTTDLNNPFGPIDENSASSLPPTSAPESIIPRKGSTASMTVVTSSYKPTPSFAQPLTIKGGVVKSGGNENKASIETEKIEKVAQESSTPSSSSPSSSPSSSQKSTLDKETQTSRELGKKENCSLM